MKDVEHAIVNVLKEQLVGNPWKGLKAVYRISGGGGIGMDFLYQTETGTWTDEHLSVRVWGRASEPLGGYSISLRDDTSKRFNKVEFVVTRDSYDVSYHWDEQLYLVELSDNARLFPQWVNDRMMSSIYKQEFPNGPVDKDEDGDPAYVSSWDSGLFTFRIKDKALITTVVLDKDGVQREFSFNTPDDLKNGILEHHELTNNGLLKATWAPWNTMVIKSPHNSLPYGKFSEYVFYNMVDIPDKRS
jgi:hypothetical protein